MDVDRGAGAVQRLEAVGVPGAGPGIADQAPDLAGPGVGQGSVNVPTAALAGAGAGQGSVVRVAASPGSGAVHETVRLKEAVPSRETEAARNPENAADLRNKADQNPNGAAARSQRAAAVVPSLGDTAGPGQTDAADPSPRKEADRRPRSTAQSRMSAATARIAADPSPRSAATASARAGPRPPIAANDRADRSPRSAAAPTPGTAVVAAAVAITTATSETAAAAAVPATETLTVHRRAPGRWPRTGRIRGRGRGHAVQETSTVHHLQTQQSPTVIARCVLPNETAARGPNRRTPTDTCEDCLALFSQPLRTRKSMSLSFCFLLQMHYNPKYHSLSALLQRSLGFAKFLGKETMYWAFPQLPFPCFFLRHCLYVISLSTTKEVGKHIQLFA